MTKIYTRTGDSGSTGLWGGARTSKDDPRVAAYGEADELNSVLGLARASLPAAAWARSLDRRLARVQEELFVIGALLASTPEGLKRLEAPFDRGVEPSSVVRLEGEIDGMTAELKPLRRFVLPGGGSPGAWLHLARTVCRRAERTAVALARREAPPEGLLAYLNRLSDWLFTAARWANARGRRTETSWRGIAR